MQRGKALISICISNLHFQEDFSYNDDDDQIFLRSDSDTLTYITYIFFCIFAEIENITQQIVIRLIKKENRIMSKNMDDASEKCVKLAAIFEEKCANCQA